MRANPILVKAGGSASRQFRTRSAAEEYSLPRYFFDTDSGTHAADDEGTDLANDDDARVQAIVFAAIT